MSFTFNWPRFSDQFHYDAIQMLNTALNKGNKPPIIADKIEVVELEMGTQPPELEIRDIGELTVDQFRGIFRLTYSGDAHLLLRTKVQANPLNHKQPDIDLMTGSRGMLAAKQPLVVPMLLRLSHFRLSSYVVLVVSKQKGITLVFKTDPLQHVDINSTFDSIAVIQNFIQREIEGQLRQMFREDLPGIIHRLSQQWIKAKVEAPYLKKPPPPVPRPRQPYETMSSPDFSFPGSDFINHSGVGLRPHLPRPHSLGTPSVKRPGSISGESRANSNRQAGITKSAAISTPSTTSSPDPNSSGDHESFDPTYGLRPEGLPTKSGFKGFSSLFAPNKGLADLTEEPGEINDDEGGDDFGDDGASTSFDVVDWEDTVPGISPPPSVYDERGNTPEYETIPAVGGGTITRPRIFHSQSSIQLPPGISPRSSLANPHSRSQGNIRSGAATPSHITRHSYSGPYSLDIPSLQNFHSIQPPRTAPFYYPSRPRTPDSVDTDPASSNSGDGINDNYPSPGNPHRTKPPDLHERPNGRQDFELPHNPTYVPRPPTERRLSISSSVSHRSTTTSLLYPGANDFTHTSHASSSYSDPNPMIILRPSPNNNSIHQLSTLSHSNHTLSPYTRSLSHFTVRSVPPRSWSGAPGAGFNGKAPVAAERQSVKARRKRLFHIGGKKDDDFIAGAVPGSGDDDAVGSGRGVRGTRNKPLQELVAPSEFDAEDMDRYFRSNEDISLPQSSLPQAPAISSSPPRVATLSVARQHEHQQQGAMNSGLPNGSPPNANARRRQLPSHLSRLF